MPTVIASTPAISSNTIGLSSVSTIPEEASPPDAWSTPTGSSSMTLAPLPSFESLPLADFPLPLPAELPAAPRDGPEPTGTAENGLSPPEVGTCGMYSSPAGEAIAAPASASEAAHVSSSPLNVFATVKTRWGGDHTDRVPRLPVEDEHHDQTTVRNGPGCGGDDRRFHVPGALLPEGIRRRGDRDLDGGARRPAEPGVAGGARGAPGDRGRGVPGGCRPAGWGVDRLGRGPGTRIRVRRQGVRLSGPLHARRLHGHVPGPRTVDRGAHRRHRLHLHALGGE